MRRLVVIFGDQLDHNHPALRDFDIETDAVWMAEARAEAGKVWSTKSRMAVFFSAMRHYAIHLGECGITVHYHDVGSHDLSMQELLRQSIQAHRPETLMAVMPGEYDVVRWLRDVESSEGLPLTILNDDHFFDSPENFADWAKDRKQLRMEYYYRELRKRTGILMEADGKPTGGEWNYDKENRSPLNADSVAAMPQPVRFLPDRITREVILWINTHLAGHPGTLDDFAWPVTRIDALRALDDFVDRRIGQFGDFQDAMWSDLPFASHSLLSACLNLKLLNPREVVSKALLALQNGKAPINAVEGFVRQILGWREYVRGIYWWKMPDYLELNALNAREPLPEFYWTADTPMRCLSQAIGQTLRHGYAHHIQRLMVTGLYALLLGVDPKQLHEWYLAVYIDAVEWVELPNTLGMSQFADGGIMASKPYVATGKYIQRMSNYCHGCRFNPAEATGAQACPFTTLYWDFLLRHQDALRTNPRMVMQLRNLKRLTGQRIKDIQSRAAQIRSAPAAPDQDFCSAST